MVIPMAGVVCRQVLHSGRLRSKPHPSGVSGALWSCGWRKVIKKGIGATPRKEPLKSTLVD